MVKRLRRRPLTAETGVRFPVELLAINWIAQPERVSKTCASIFFWRIEIQVPKHAALLFICIWCCIYAYQLRCTKQVVLTTLKKIFLFPPPLQNQPSMAVCNSAGIHAVCGCILSRAIRITKLLPKVVIYIDITWHILSLWKHVFTSESI